MKRIDLNCDMGERSGPMISGPDETLMPLISSSSIACGFHSGDPSVMHDTIRLANKFGVAVGAHPSYPDLQGFGRREMALDAQEVYDIMLYQIGALAAFTKAAGVKLQHVKPHGALYNRAAADAEIATAVVHAVYYFDPKLILFCPPQSAMAVAAEQLGLPFRREAFADRTYLSTGKLTPRTAEYALAPDENFAVNQVLDIILNKSVTTIDGKRIHMEADTICIHGDGPMAVSILKTLRKSLTENNIQIQSPLYNNAT